MNVVAIVVAAATPIADGEEQDCRILFEPPRREPEHPRGRPVESVRVLHHAEERRLRHPICNQPERREADQEQVGSGALANPERRLERTSLRLGKEIETAEQGSTNW